MALINIEKREIHCKIVYYGPGMSGKTTTLQYVHWQMPELNRGELLSIATETERTLFFDCLPPDQLPLRGFQIRFHLYTVPGCVLPEQKRLAVLQGVDGLVFVADSQRHKLRENLRSMHELKQGLPHYERDIRTCPLVLQYNKRDVPNALAATKLDHHLNHYGWQRFETIATEGPGVMETFGAICTEVIDALVRPKEPATQRPSVWSEWFHSLKARIQREA